MLISGGVALSALLFWYRWGKLSKSTVGNSEIFESTHVSHEERTKLLNIASELRAKGNAFFQHAEYDKALDVYENCQQVLSALGKDSEGVTQQQIVLSNVVLCLCKLHRHMEACFVATELLQSEEALPENLKPKVLYRRGLASRALENFDAARADFKAAIELSKDGNAEAEKALISMSNG